MEECSEKKSSEAKGQKFWHFRVCQVQFLVSILCTLAIFQSGCSLLSQDRRILNNSSESAAPGVSQEQVFLVPPSELNDFGAAQDSGQNGTAASDEEGASAQPDATATSTEWVTILATGISDRESLARQAERLGIKLSGQAVLELKGTRENLALLTISAAEKSAVIRDRLVSLEKPEPLAKPVEETYYLAQEDFELPEFLKNNPSHDGRGTIIGIIDDGVSLFQTGLQKTSTGERKIKGFYSAGSELNIVLQDEDTAPAPAGGSVSLLPGAFRGRESSYAKVYTGELSEPTLVRSLSDAGAGKEETFADWNENGVQDSYILGVGKKLDGTFEICIDLNGNLEPDPQECFEDFRQSGSFGFWKEGSLRNLAAHFDEVSQVLSLVEGEMSGDSHGEGVASVAAGFQLGGRFNGVAPGAQILDYDLSVRSGDVLAQNYTIGTFTRALEWLGSQGADVVNISYSLFFQSVQGQLFMQRALQELVDKYQYVISFSAGNNGPGLSSLNRRAIYPPDTLVAGAFVGKKLYEYVHGVTGLPEQGRVVSYSSRGPGPFGEMGPTLLAPLSSLTLTAPGGGYGAFSGTSSASPALAGFASVLISSAMQENLPIHPGLVVHAMRLSGSPLEGVPFVEQGAGLPKISKAIELYRQLVKGSLPLRLEVSIPLAPVAGEIFGDALGQGTQAPGARQTPRAAAGIALRTSLLSESQGAPGFEFTATLKAVVSPTLSEREATNLLFPFDVEYSAGWVSGPAKSFASVGSSTITITVDEEKARAELSANKTTEIFASVSLVHPQTREVLWTIPVTFIDDKLLLKTQKFRAVLETEEVKRHHFNVGASVQALRVQANLKSGSDQGLSLSVFDPNGVRIKTFSRLREIDALLPLKEKGWYQITVTKYKGGDQKSEISASISSVSLSLDSSVFDLQTGQLFISNNSSDIIEGTLEFRMPFSPLKSEIFRLKAGFKYARLQFALRGYERKVSLAVESLFAQGWNFFDGSGHSCLWDLSDADENPLGVFSGSNGSVLDLSAYKVNLEGEPGSGAEAGSHGVRSVAVTCTVFENSDINVLEGNLRMTASVLHDNAGSDEIREARETVENWSAQAGLFLVSLRPGLNVVSMPALLKSKLSTARFTNIEVLMRSASQLPQDGFVLGRAEILE